jgi:F0F1-type ATP synthase assembly protein I
MTSSKSPSRRGVLLISLGVLVGLSADLIAGYGPSGMVLGTAIGALLATVERWRSRD